MKELKKPLRIIKLPSIGTARTDKDVHIFGARGEERYIYIPAGTKEGMLKTWRDIRETFKAKLETIDEVITALECRVSTEDD